MLKKNIQMALLITGALISSATPIHANAMTIQNLGIHHQVVESAKTVTNPDLLMTESQLLEKYQDMTYEDIINQYQIDTIPMEDLTKITETCPALKNKIRFTKEEMDLLYRMVFTESGNQDEATQKAVTSVIINRIFDDGANFPDTLYDVCMQKNQFEVVSTGAYLKKTPTEATIQYVNEVCQNGITIPARVVFFRNDYYHNDYVDEFKSGILYFSSMP